jgi:ABC-2 type transport system permease protein
MIKTWHVAWREFICTVVTRGFIIGILLPPVIMIAALTLMPILMNAAPPKTSGRIAIIDRGGKALPQLEAEFTPEKLAESRRHKAEQVKQQAKKFTPPGQEGAVNASMAGMAGPEATLTLEPLSADAKVDEAKGKIPTVRSRKDLAPDARLALIVIPAETIAGGYTPPVDPSKPVEEEAKPGYAPFELYTTPTLDPEVKDQIERAAKRAIVNTRIAGTGMDIAKVRGLLSDPETKAMTVTEGGERSTNDVAAMMIPGAFLFLLWISVFTAGQYLMTTTIEEKSNRVMEVLLSAASPLQIMVGKIMGQMAVGGVIMALYSSTGVLALAYFALNHLIDPMKLVYLGVYFLIAFFLIACLMAAVGSAVSDIREAQSLMGPIMIVLIIPMILWFPILRNPNSMFATVCSFLPPISPFIMVLRLAGSEPVPLWQVPASIAAGLFYVVVAAWGASKIFRIGVLMYGKPPNIGTLIKWIRMA